MFNQTFCSSPWFHLRLNYDGFFVPCRWSAGSDKKYNFKNTSLMQFYNSDQMAELRQNLLNGQQPEICKACYYQDSFGKLSGRVKQLNKSGVVRDNFELSLRSSPHYEYFKYSQENNGQANHHPVDLQIDLGNVCNSACIMCRPIASSKLVTDYVKLHKIAPDLFENFSNYKSWTTDPELVNRFVDELSQIPNLRYIHFLGGETLYDPAFYKICDKLIETGLNKNIIIGTTTNATIYDDRLENLIKNFKEFHLGVSIETVSKLNDYIRYPSSIDTVMDNVKKFLALRDTANLYVSLRITPNIFTIYEFDEVVEFMIENNVAAESCNILYEPPSLKMELMPEDIRQETIGKFKALTQKYNLSKENIVNGRVSSLIQQVISNITLEYLNFLESYTVPDDVEKLRFELVRFLKSFESLRHNTIIDYAPRYTDFLRSYGY